MIEPVLLDTGPLVAFLSDDDVHHKACLDALAALRKRPITTWPVLTEAAWLLRSRPKALVTLFSSIGDRFATVIDLPPAARVWIAGFLERYSSAKAQLADASLVYLAGTRELDTVLTLDRRDFGIYRTSDGRSLRILPEG